MAAPAEDASDDLDRHVRRVAPDRWLAARLIAEAPARAEVLALYALDDEFARTALSVSQPMLGEIRLQWWREALARAAGGGAAEHPAISALKPALQAGRLRLDRLDALIDGHVAALEPAPFADAAQLRAWIDAVFGAVMALAARLLDPSATDDAVFLGPGRAWGWAMLARAAPTWRAKGRHPWPLAWGDAPETAGALVLAEVDAALKAAKHELKTLPTAAFPAVAYAALSRDYACGREPSELARRARLLWAAARGRI